MSIARSLNVYVICIVVFVIVFFVVRAHLLNDSDNAKKEANEINRISGVGKTSAVNSKRSANPFEVSGQTDNETDSVNDRIEAEEVADQKKT